MGDVTLMKKWDDIKERGSESGAASGDKNTISAEISGVMASLSIGMKF